MRSILIIAGESSGDIHGANILQRIREYNPNIKIIGIGGRCMTPLLDYKLADVVDMSVMGFTEVIRCLPRLARIFFRTLRIAIKEDVSNVLFIDYPGFNIKFAKVIKRIIPNVKLHQFVCPQVWAWRPSRIIDIGYLIDVLYCLFEFEPNLFIDYKVNAIYVGNPIVDHICIELDRTTFFNHYQLDCRKPLIALLPGSRLEEIKLLMPSLVELVRFWKSNLDYDLIQWIIPLASTIDKDDLSLYYDASDGIYMVSGATYSTLAYSDAAIVCSGTATLETAIIGTPFIVIYKTNILTYYIAKTLISIPFLSIINIVYGKQIVRELIQSEVNVASLTEALLDLFKPSNLIHMRYRFNAFKKTLVMRPSALERIVNKIIEYIY